MGNPIKMPIPVKQKIVPNIIFNKPTDFLLGFQSKGNITRPIEKRAVKI